MLLPYKKSFVGDAAALDVIGGVALAATPSSSSPSPSSSSGGSPGGHGRASSTDEVDVDHAAVALCLLSAQFAKLIHDHAQHGGSGSAGARDELAATGAAASRSPGPAVFHALPAVATRTPAKTTPGGGPGATNYHTFSPAHGGDVERRPSGEVLVATLLDKVTAMETTLGAAHRRALQVPSLYFPPLSFLALSYRCSRILRLSTTSAAHPPPLPLSPPPRPRSLAHLVRALQDNDRLRAALEALHGRVAQESRDFARTVAALQVRPAPPFRGPYLAPI